MFSHFRVAPSGSGVSSMQLYSIKTAPQSARWAVMLPKSVSRTSSGAVSSREVPKGKKSSCVPSSKNSSSPLLPVQIRAKSVAGTGLGTAIPVETASFGGGAAEGDVSGWKLLHKIDPAENRTSVSRTMRMGKRNRRRFSRDGFSSFGCSGVSVSSATDTPNSLARAMRFVMSGVAALVSHLLTAWRLTPSRAPSSS